jgi:hypothetical protein
MLSTYFHGCERLLRVTEIITERCLAVYSILIREPIRVGSMIAQSIKRMITSSDTYIGHPYVISHLCSLAGVPEEDDDTMIGPQVLLGERFLSRAQRDLTRAVAAQQGQPHQPPPQQQQQVP